MSDEQREQRATDGADAMADGMEQFQRAALDALAAARSMIEAAESVVRQPGAVEALVSTISDLARTGTQTVSNIVSEAAKASGGGSGHRRTADVFTADGDDAADEADDDSGDDDSDDDDDSGDGGFEPISVR